MSPQIIRHPQSRRDVDDAAVFLAEESSAIAFRFLEAVEQTLRGLVKMPEMGALRHYQKPELEGLRMMPVRGFEKYLIFYRPTDDGIEIFRVLHASRDIGSLFGDAG